MTCEQFQSCSSTAIFPNARDTGLSIFNGIYKFWHHQAYDVIGLRNGLITVCYLMIDTIKFTLPYFIVLPESYTVFIRKLTLLTKSGRHLHMMISTGPGDPNISKKNC